MPLEGSAIAAIVTGVLALGGVLTSAWMSGWNERRTATRKNKKALTKYAAPLLIASWDLANWFYDILDERNYSPQRCKAYGNGWNSQFTSYLIGAFFASIHIVREKTHYLAHIKGKEAETLKKLLWKISDEFISMEYEDRESLEMRWFEGDILAVQEHMTELADLNGDGVAGEMRVIGWVDFKKKYVVKEPGSENKKAVGLTKIFDWYEMEFQRIIYRRFKNLYANSFKGFDNPQDFERMTASMSDEKLIERYVEAEKLIVQEQDDSRSDKLVVPDHRVRRLQHLLSDLVILLDQLSNMRFNRPIRKCKMIADGTGDQIPCDCHSTGCNPKQVDFEHRQLAGTEYMKLRAQMTSGANPTRRVVTWPGTKIKTESGTVSQV